MKFVKLLLQRWAWDHLPPEGQKLIRAIDPAAVPAGRK